MAAEIKPTSSKIRVTILDDHQSVIDGYVFRLGKSPRIEVIGSAIYGVELEPMLAAHHADVLLLDVSVPTAPENPNPYPILHVIPRLVQLYPDLSILAISMLTERALIRTIMEAGARGYILKDDREAIRELDQIVIAVAQGGIYLSAQARQQFDKPDAKQTRITLTPRQLEALSIFAAYPDMPSREVAGKLCIDPSTLRNTLSNAYFRLGVHNLTAAVAKARQLGLITPLSPAMPH